MEKSKLELIKEFVEECPLLEGNKISVDYLKDEVYSYSIDRTPVNDVVYNFVDGGSKKQIAFDFCVTAPLSSQSLVNLENSKFCDDFCDWIEEQNKKRNLPKIDGAFSIKTNTGGYILQKTETTAIYIIQLNFVYYKLG